MSERVRARALRDRLQLVKRSSTQETLEEQLSRVPVGTAVIAYTVLPNHVLAWRVTRSLLRMRVLPLPRWALTLGVERLRRRLRGSGSAGDVRDSASDLFDALCREVLEDLPPDTELIFIPDRELHFVPFSALFNSSTGRYLIEDYSCSVAPSFETYLSSLDGRDFARFPPTKVLAVGNPDFDQSRFPLLRPLPAANEEARQVSALYGDGKLLLKGDATRERILRNLSDSEVFSLAAHVIVDSQDPLESVVATGKAGSQPLRVSDLTAERLKGVDLAFLSACNTAPGFVNGDREGVAGLARGFLGAGVPYVVATLWSVRDGPAAELSKEFHSRLVRGSTPAEALRQAQLALLRKGGRVRFDWAPFQLFRGR
jgi:CHAT domain-containing protein